MDQNPVTTAPVAPAPTSPAPTVAPVDSANTPALDPAPTLPPVDTAAAVTPDTSSLPTEDTAAIDPEIPRQVAKKIADAQNVLIALSGDPSVDEMAAAIGLSLYLDKLGKRATAIYSGATPNALEFLKPEDTFESTADTLQDFVIALNKDKADHLRYKLDGDYVKIFITPYKTRIDQEDLEFSYGDFNVDLVLALDVANGIDLDAALREHGRIMHDAVIVNITTGNPGRFGEIEWSDKTASSVSEMIARLLYDLGSKVPIDKEEATAFLTGIVAATDRFSNAKTTPGTMQIASKLMESGANQQLISKNITPDVDNELYSLLGPSSTKRENDPTKLDIEHAGKESSDDSAATPKEVDTVIAQPPTLLDDLKAAEASLATAGAEAVPDDSHQPIRLDRGIDSSLSDTGGLAEQPEKVIQPSPGINLEAPDEGSKKYGKMLEDALSGLGGSNEPIAPIVSEENPATMMAPQVPDNPEINGVPEMNYMPFPGEEVLPPPPAPPIDMAAPTIGEPATSVPDLNTPIMPSALDAQTSSDSTLSASSPDIAPIAPAMPTVDSGSPSLPPIGPQPAMQDQVYNPPATDPGAFKIPGM